MFRAHYEQLAALFAYPESDYLFRVSSTRASLAKGYPQAAADIDEFLALVPQPSKDLPVPLERVQEVFTRTFEVQSITTLDVGYLMFGDDYKRAELLVQLNRELREAKVNVGRELPDHLSSILRLLARWKDREMAQELVQYVLHPTVQAMVFEFREERVEQRNSLYKKHYKTVLDIDRDRLIMFRHLLKAVQRVLEVDFEVETVPEIPESTAFLRSLQREFEIEERGAGHRPSAMRPDPVAAGNGCQVGGANNVR